MNKFNLIKNKRGESLLEVVVSLAIFSILVTTLLTVIMSATGINTKAVRTNKQDQTNTTGFELTDPPTATGVTYVPKADVPTGGVHTVSINVSSFKAQYIPSPPPPTLPAPISVPTLDFERGGKVYTGTPAGEKLPLKKFSPN